MAKVSALRRARRLARELIERYGIREPEKLYKELGIKLYDCPDFQDLKGMYASVLDRPCVFIKADLPTNMRKLILAHELGHHLLHADMLHDLAILRDHSLFNMSSGPEIEANLFAAELLIEDKQFLDLAQAGLSLEQIARAFNQPIELLRLKADLLYDAGVPLRLPEPYAGDFLRGG